ncbi:MAG: hypothetical protein IPH22_01705 [Nitrosomonas sp.]|nr:hypothetical protein [Nitrosomonas sp.]
MALQSALNNRCAIHIVIPAQAEIQDCRQHDVNVVASATQNDVNRTPSRPFASCNQRKALKKQKGANAPIPDYTQA